MSIPFRRSLKEGFTLVELLVVIAIIAVLSTIMLLQLGTARAKARDTKRMTDINGIRTAVEFYFDDNGNAYPADITDTLIGKYIAGGKVPKDPVTAVAYFYAYSPTSGKATKYHLWTELESKNLSALNGDVDMDSSSAAWAGAGKYNATITPTNTEACAASYDAGVARDCIYDVGQN